MHLSLYTGSLSNSFQNKFYILSHFSLYFSYVSLSLTERFMHLLFLSKYLGYAFICGNLFTMVMEGHSLYVYIPENIYMNIYCNMILY